MKKFDFGFLMFAVAATTAHAANAVRATTPPRMLETAPLRFIGTGDQLSGKSDDRPPDGSPTETNAPSVQTPMLSFMGTGNTEAATGTGPVRTTIQTGTLRFIGDAPATLRPR